MTRFARELPAAKTWVRDIARPGSFFELKRKIFWDFGATVARLFSQARQLNAGTLVIEVLPDEGELREETEDLTSRCGGILPKTSVWRLTFFTGKFAEAGALRGPHTGLCLGYAILRRDEMQDPLPDNARIYESVMVSLDRGHNYARGAPRWKVRCGEAFFEVVGHLFAEQNNLTNVCAHAALRSVCCRGGATEELSYRQINRLLGIDHVSEQVGYHANGKTVDRGLNEKDIKAILGVQGLRSITHFYGHRGVGKSIGFDAAFSPPYPYQRALYTCVESGFPALLAFGRVVTLQGEDGKPDLDPSDTVFHIIPVFGHTFNQDTWVPRAETTWFGFHIGQSRGYLPSDLWLSAFIGHDDVVGSNYCIPKHYLPPLLLERTGDELPRGNGVMAVIQTLPAMAKRDPIDAELQAHYALGKLFEQKPLWLYRRLPLPSMHWFHHIRHELDEGRLIIRPLLITAAAYREHLINLRGWADRAEHQERISTAWLEVAGSLGSGGDACFWMIEFSVMELFPANLRKLGEVIVSASDERSAMEANQCILAVRLPGIGLVRNGEGWDAQAWRLIETGVVDHACLLGAEHRDHALGNVPGDEGSVHG